MAALKFPHELDNLTLAQVADGLDKGVFSVANLTAAHLEQIRKWNPILHAVIDVNPNAMRDAAELDRELAAGQRRGPLHGVPILVKDNVTTPVFGGATAGSLCLVGSETRRANAAVVRLLDAGCLLLGTANLSEWANFRSANGTEDNGWSGRGGQTYGAYGHARMDPSGSSSGSAVAVDVGMCLLAVGTETSGSIICPADRNNVVGIKPTVGLVSRNAVLPLSPSQDTVGPLARTLRDAAAMLTVMAGPDDDDKRTGDIPFTAIPDYVNSARERDLSGTRIGIPRDALDDVPTDVMEAFDRAIAQLGKLGVETVDLDLSCASRYRELEKSRALFNSLCPEFNVATTEYLSALVMNPHNIKNMQDIIDFTKREPAEEYPKRDIHWFEASKCLDYSSPEYAEGLKDSAIFAGEQGIMGALDGYGRLDALLAPSCAELPNYAAARGGFPIVSVPLGYRPYGTPAEWNDTGNLVTNGPNMPYGISVIGRKFSEEVLLAIAYALEQASQTRTTARDRRVHDIHQLPELTS